MMTLIAAAVVAAAQPAPPADAHAHVEGMTPDQNSTKKTDCQCCANKGMHEHEDHASGEPQEHRGE